MRGVTSASTHLIRHKDFRMTKVFFLIFNAFASLMAKAAQGRARQARPVIS